jgi:hypothetical protein
MDVPIGPYGMGTLVGFLNRGGLKPQSDRSILCEPRHCTDLSCHHGRIDAALEAHRTWPTLDPGLSRRAASLVETACASNVDIPATGICPRRITSSTSTQCSTFMFGCMYMRC